MATDYQFSFRCPFCNHDTTIIQTNFSEQKHLLNIDNPQGTLRITTLFIVCPNKECRKVSLQAFLDRVELARIRVSGETVVAKQELIKKWNLIPPSKARAFPSYVPPQILKDYEEACLILDSSPKASATLSRRCLQGIIRDFWKICKPRLKDEIDEIKNKCDIETWEAIDGIRKIGNIGAHFEKDINLIIEVEPDEAELLIKLIETLFKDWYINKYERQSRLEEIKKISETKESKRKEKKD